MNAGERITGTRTGTRDEHYNLISVLYHALHGAENCEIYALDAEAASDNDLAIFFRNAQATQRQLAERAKERLGIRDIVTPRGIVTPETAEVGTEVPPEGMVGPEAPSAPRHVRRETSPKVAPLSEEVTPEVLEPRDVPRDVPPEDIEPGSGPPRDVPPETRPR
jgi:hypothetical protein